MKEKKIGIFTLAVSLILLGVLFLMNNFMDMKIYHILSIAWPVIIILLGLEIIFSKILFGKDDSKLAISGKSIFFIILIVGIAFIFSNIHQIPLYLDINGDFIPMVYKNETITNKDIKIQVKDKSKLKIINGFGHVNVKKGEGKDIKVNMLVKMRHNYEEKEAERIASDMLKVINDSSDTIKLINNREKYTVNNQVKNLEVDLDITIPYDMELDITNKYGEIIVNDCGKAAIIENKHGNVFIDTLNGNIDVKNSYGEIEIADVQGNVKVENRHGKVLVNQISKDVSIAVEYGVVKINDIGGNADISNTHEPIAAQKIGGNLAIESKYCELDIDEVNKDLNINGKHGNIQCEKIGGDARINNEHGSIKLVQANKSVDIKNRYGQIVFESNELISEKLEIENEHDGIDITLPDSQEGTFNIYSKHGRINNSFGLDVNKDNNEESIKQSIGNSNVKININAINGDIRIDN